MKLTAALVARISGAAIFLALIRTISEVFRLHYVNPASFGYELIKPFLAGALICAAALQAINLLYAYRRYRVATATAAVTVALLLTIKFYYAIPG